MSGNRIFNCQWNKQKQKLYLDSERDGCDSPVRPMDFYLQRPQLNQDLPANPRKHAGSISVLCKLLLPGNLSFRLRCGLMLMRTRMCKMSDWGPLQLTGSDRISRWLTFCLPQQNWDEPIRPTQSVPVHKTNAPSLRVEVQPKSHHWHLDLVLQWPQVALVWSHQRLGCQLSSCILSWGWHRGSLVPHSERWARGQTSSQEKWWKRNEP